MGNQPTTDNEASTARLPPPPPTRTKDVATKMATTDDETTATATATTAARTDAEATTATATATTTNAETTTTPTATTTTTTTTKTTTARGASEAAGPNDAAAAAAAAADDDDDDDDGRPIKRVLIIGAGPAGLLAAIFLLRRNLRKSSSSTTAFPSVKYHVTIVDPGVDYGAFDSDGLKRHRSWMIGLGFHGLSAIQRVPDLYETYLLHMGLSIEHAVVSFKNFRRHMNVKDLNLMMGSLLVDRNYIVAGLARYLNDHFGQSDMLVSHYETKAVFVDGENRRVLVRNKRTATTTTTTTTTAAAPTPLERYLEYDVLLGCDGIRSVVRNAFVANERDFEFDLKGTFGTGKSIHIPQPENVKEGTFMMMVKCMENATAFALPETGRMLNIGFGFSLDHPVPPELQSDDIKVVSAYFKKHFTSFQYDPDIIATEWVNQSWNSIGMVHCNFYHSTAMKALLLGDAAHATSPQIGEGMNHAFADAETIDTLLDRFGDDDWDNVLVEFSNERVKEGNALTDLSFYTLSLSSAQQMWIMTWNQVQDFLHRYLPFLFGYFPMTEIAVKGIKLSEAYDKMHKLGLIQKVRHTNDSIMREHFERKVGMVKYDRPRGGTFGSPWFVSAVVTIGAGVWYATMGRMRGVAS